MAWVFAAVVVLAVGFAAAWLWLEQPPCVKRRVMVNLKSDEDAAYEGILWSTRGRWITLKDVTAHKVERPSLRVDGEAVFHRDAILFMQILPGREG